MIYLFRLGGVVEDHDDGVGEHSLLLKLLFPSYGNDI